MTYRTNQIGNSLVLTGEGDHVDTNLTVPVNTFGGMSAGEKTAYLDQAFADAHAQRLRMDEGKGWRAE